MKKYFTLFLGATISFFGCAQSVSEHLLDMNNADALVNDGGVFFNQTSTSLAGYTIPSGSSLNTLFAMSFWYGGLDVNGQLKISAQKYDPLSDQFKGPLTTDGSAEVGPSGAWSNALFPVTKVEIDFHIANYMTQGYVPVSNIANWPAHGDVASNFDFYLAPFVDVDNDGMYNPLMGDYPCIRGDQAVYVIMNDKGGTHASGGDPLGIEMHYMFYEFVGISEIENTTFVTGKVINRGIQTINEFKVSVFMDGDIGYSGDDYFGSDSHRNLMYFYNGDNMDENTPGSLGYGVAPPASGVMSLSKDFESIGTSSGTLLTAFSYWNIMNGISNATGLPWTNPVTSAATSFMFESDPSNAMQLDSEVAQANAPGDRRGVASLDFGTLAPNDEVKFDYAIIYYRDTISSFENASKLASIADIVQAFFDTSFVDDCLLNVIGLDELSEIDFSIFPNPSNGEFTISLETSFSNAEVKIYDVFGRSVLDRTELKSNYATIELNQPSGVYLLHLIVDGQKLIKRMILE